MCWVLFRALYIWETTWQVIEYRSWSQTAWSEMFSPTSLDT